MILKATKFIASVSVHNSGAMVQQQIFERVVEVSDEAYRWLWEVLVLAAYVVLAWRSLVDFFWVGWGDDLEMMLAAILDMVVGYAFIPTQATG